MSEGKRYDSERDIMEMDRAGNYYCRHVSAMTREALHSKSDIAAELGWRDMQIDQLKADNEAYKKLHDWLKAENERLANCLRNANESAEKFERDWYLVSDERDTLLKQLDEARELLNDSRNKINYMRRNGEWYQPQFLLERIDDWMEANHKQP